MASNRVRKFLLRLFLFALLPGLWPSLAGAEDAARNFDSIRRSVVHIKTTLFRYSYKNPWREPYISRSAGTGLIIEGNRILTNAHVVSGANTIRIRRPNQRTDYKVRVAHIAHDCDLALLSVDASEFFKGAKPLAIGDLPRLNSPVEVIGFPIGGDRVSITRGIVSRIDMDVYAHSGIDYHLIIQVDAAINPGNSGGPAIQDGKVIGIAFQVLSSGENLGYLIPPQVIRRFLADIKDGSYDGYTEFGVLDIPTEHPGLRQALGLQKIATPPETGVLVYRVIPGSSADGYLKPKDILLKINGKGITENGDVSLNDDLQNYTQIVDNLHKGEPVKVEILRGTKRLKLYFPSKSTRVFNFRRKNYESPPSYFMTGGLVFQPLDANLVKTYSSRWSLLRHLEIEFRYNYFFTNKIYKHTSEDVVLTRRLPDKVNIYAENFEHRLVKKVNGKKTKGFSHFINLIDSAIANESYLVIDFHNVPVPLILQSAVLRKAKRRISKRYGISQDRFIGSIFRQKNTP